MRVLIPAVLASKSPDGITRYAVNLARTLSECAEIDCIRLMVGPWQEASARALLDRHCERVQIVTASVVNTALARNLWHWRELPAVAAAWRADLVHAAYPVPVRRKLFACPVVATLHDFYPWDEPYNFGYPRVLLNRLVLRQCLSAADAITCVSKSTQRRLTMHDADAHGKSCCILNCVEPCDAPASVEFSLTEQPFLLVVAQHRRNKNLALTVKIFERMRRYIPTLKLLIIGNAGPETPSLHKALASCKLFAHTLFLNGITEAEMHWCYRHAEALLATSTTEGFGLPVAEALLVGCPVVCSDIAAFRELGQDRCTFIPLSRDAVASFSEALLTVVSRPRPDAIALPHLSAPALAQRYLLLYRHLLEGHPQPSMLRWALSETKGGVL